MQTSMKVFHNIIKGRQNYWCLQWNDLRLLAKFLIGYLALPAFLLRHRHRRQQSRNTITGVVRVLMIMGLMTGEPNLWEVKLETTIRLWSSEMQLASDISVSQPNVCTEFACNRRKLACDEHSIYSRELLTLVTRIHTNATFVRIKNFSQV